MPGQWDRRHSKTVTAPLPAIADLEDIVSLLMAKARVRAVEFRFVEESDPCPVPAGDLLHRGAAHSAQ